MEPVAISSKLVSDFWRMQKNSSSGQKLLVNLQLWLGQSLDSAWGCKFLRVNGVIPGWCNWESLASTSTVGGFNIINILWITSTPPCHWQVAAVGLEVTTWTWSSQALKLQWLGQLEVGCDSESGGLGWRSPWTAGSIRPLLQTSLRSYSCVAALQSVVFNNYGTLRDEYLGRTWAFDTKRT